MAKQRTYVGDNGQTQDEGGIQQRSPSGPFTPTQEWMDGPAGQSGGGMDPNAGQDAINKGQDNPVTDWTIGSTPTPIDPEPGRSSESPRERLPVPQPTPTRPTSPTPMPGSPDPLPQPEPAPGPTIGEPAGPPPGGGGPSGPPIPTINPPLGGGPSTDPTQPVPGQAKLRGPSLFGSQGGLQGGGLGVPLNPTNSTQSDPISSLIKQLLQQGR